MMSPKRLEELKELATRFNRQVDFPPVNRLAVGLLDAVKEIEELRGLITCSKCGAIISIHPLPHHPCRGP